MDDKPDYNLLSEIMRNANMGWWEADLQSERRTAAHNHSFLRQHTADKRGCLSAQHHQGTRMDAQQNLHAKKRGEGKQQGLRHSRSARWPIHVVRLTTVATTGTAFAQHLQKLAGGHRALQHARGADRSE